MNAESTFIDWNETRRMAAEMISLGHKLLSAVENGDPRRDNVDLKIKFIRSVVAAKYGFSADGLLKRQRTEQIASARMVAMVLCREFVKCQDRVIEADFLRTHGCIANAIEKVTARCECEPDFAAQVSDLRLLISQNDLFKN